MRVADIVEAEDDDRSARASAMSVFQKIKAYLERAEDDPEAYLKPQRYAGGSFMVRAQRVAKDLPDDLVFGFTPQGNNHGFGHLPDGTSVILISCLIRPGDPKFLATRFGAKVASFVHEFQHYLLSKRTGDKKTSAAKADSGDMTGYYNDAEETNAFFHEAVIEFERLIQGLINFVHLDSAKKVLGDYLSKSDQELVGEIKSEADKRFLASLTPENVRRFEKRAARYVRETLRPMIEKSLTPMETHPKS